MDLRRLVLATALVAICLPATAQQTPKNLTATYNALADGILALHRAEAEMARSILVAHRDAAAAAAAKGEWEEAAAQIALPGRAQLDVHWLHRGDAAEGSLLEAALRQVTLPQGKGYVWAAGEAAAMKAVRQYLVNERGIDKKRIRASAYWKRGDAAVHETLDD